MAEEAKVKIVLDSKHALSGLRGLTRQAASTAARVSGSIASTLGRGAGIVGLGGGLATGAAAVRGATESGFGDIVSEAFRPLGVALNERLLGDLDEKARAARGAREETIQAFGAIAGATNSFPLGAKEYYNQALALREQEEIGRKKLEEGLPGGVKPDEVFDKIFAGLKEIAIDAVTELASKLNPFDGK